MATSFNGNKQVHTFMRGMNMDLDISLLQEGMYSHATNIRLTPDGSQTGGTINAVRGFFNINSGDLKYTYYEDGILKTEPFTDSYTVIGVSKIRNYGVIFTKDRSSMHSVFRVSVDANDHYSLHRVVHLEIDIESNSANKLSIVTHWEDVDNVKVYWADGKNNLRFVNIAPSRDKDNSTINERAIDNTIGAEITKPEFVKFEPGSLKCGLVQYMYQLFNVNGAETRISPPTSLIQLSDSEPNSLVYSGNGPTVSSGKTVTLKFKSESAGLTNGRIFRISYLDADKLPTVEIAGEFELSPQLESGAWYQYYTDSGSVLSEITFEELIASAPYSFIPGVIEAKDNILFAGNIKESNVIEGQFDFDARAFRFNNLGDSSSAHLMSDSEDDMAVRKIDFDKSDDDWEAFLPSTHDALAPYNIDSASKYKYTLPINGKQYIGGTGRNVTYKLITSRFGHDFVESTSNIRRDVYNTNYKHDIRGGSSYDYKISRNTSRNSNNVPFNYGTPSSLLDSYDTYDKTLYIPGLRDYGDINYSNVLLSSAYRSYQRDELYRFGLVLYSKSGAKSEVKWIGDIRMPKISEEAWRLFDLNERITLTDNSVDVYQVVSYPLGIEFTISNLPAGIHKVEIVRCDRTRLDRSIISQGILGSTTEFEDGGSSTSPHGYVNYSGGTVWSHPGVTSLSYQDSYISNTEWNNYSRYIISNPRCVTFLSPEVSYFGEQLSDLYKRGNKLDILVGLYSPAIPRTIAANLYPKNRFYYSNVSNAHTGYFNGIPREQKYYGDGISGDGFVLETGFYTRNGVDNQGYTSRVFKYYAPFSEYTTLIEGSSWNTHTNRKIQISDLPTISLGASVFAEAIAYENGDEATNGGFQISVSNVNYTNWSFYKKKDSERSINFKHGPYAECIVLEHENFEGVLPRINQLGYTRQHETHYSSYHGVQNRKVTGLAGGSATLDDRYKLGVMETITGTFLVNLKNTIIPYGGRGHASRSASTYISTGFMLDVNVDKSEGIVFGGDTFISLAEIVSRHSQFPKADPMPPITDWWLKEGRSGQNTIIFPCESSINLELVNGGLLTKTAGFAKTLQLSAGSRPNGDAQSKNLYAYNSSYSSSDVSVKFLPRGTYQKDNKSFDYRVMYSEVKTNDEISDNWLKFKPFNYVDLDTRFGELTNLKLYRNTLSFWQKDAFGNLPVNQQALLKSDDIAGLLLGTGEVLGKPQYVSTVNGSYLRSITNIVTADSGLYWYDHDRSEILRYDGEMLMSLTKSKGMQSFFNDRKGNISKDIKTVYDKEYNEIIFNFYGDKEFNLVFNEAVDVFSSFYTYRSDWFIPIGDNIYSLFNNDLFKHNSLDSLNRFETGLTNPSTIQYHVNQDYHSTKTFSSLSLYKEIESGKLTFDFNTKNAGGVASEIMDIREENSLLSIPRGNNEDTLSTILPTTSQRLKGKYLTTSLKYDPQGSTQFKIPYIITSYRHSKI